MSPSSSSSSDSGSSSSAESSSRESSPGPRPYATDSAIRLEGPDPSWPYQPPPGSIPYEHGQVDPAEFDWGAVEDDEDIELVLLRVPSRVSDYSANLLASRELKCLPGESQTSCWN